MKFRKLLWMECYRSIVNRKFLMIVFLVAVIMVLGDTMSIKAYFLYGYRGDMTQHVYTVMLFDRYKAILAVVLAGVSCYSMSDDLSSRYARQILSRVTVKQYVLAKVMANGIAVLLAIVAGFCLFPIITSPFMVLTGEFYDPKQLDYFSEVAEKASPVAYFVLVAILFGSFVVAVTTFGMWVTVKRPSRYVALAVPFGILYMMYSLGTYFPRPFWFWYMSSGVTVLGTTDFLSNYAYGMGWFAALTVVAGFGCYRSMKRRFADGKI